ncbi:MAG TPA: sulfite exporter TauE/SafE family protein [Burkholderiales bacterium]|nr:sulfite exporter TauE/SafE family protein [Burkholderiales bacterium]
MIPFGHDALVVALAAVFVGYLLFGISGFGASFITVPLMSLSQPMPYVLALAVLLDFSAALTVSARARRNADLGEVLRILPFTLIGSLLGVLLLVRLPKAATLISLGVFMLGYGLYSLRGHAPEGHVSRWWVVPAGITGGIMGALFGVGGPPAIIYLSRRPLDKDALRSTVATFIVIGVGMRLVIFALAGLLLKAEVAVGYLLLLPAGAAGLWAGHKLHAKFSRAAVMRVLYGVLVVGGASLIYRALE